MTVKESTVTVYRLKSDWSTAGHFASPVSQRGTACRQTFEPLLL